MVFRFTDTTLADVTELYRMTQGIFTDVHNTGCAIDHMLRANGSYSLIWGDGECTIALSHINAGLQPSEVAKLIIAERKSKLLKETRISVK